MIGCSQEHKLEYVSYKEVVIVTCGLVLLIGVRTDLWHCVTL